MGEEPDWDVLLNKMDQNNDGLIDYNEFVSAFSSSKKLINE